MSKVDAIQERQRRTDENFGKPFQSQAELDRAYLLAKVKQWKRIAVRFQNERNTAEEKVAALLDRVDELREQVGIEVRAKDEWEEDAATAETERDNALASRNSYWERLRSAERLLAEARGLLNHDQTEIVAEMDRVREQNRIQWEEARAERAERIAERDAEIDQLRAQLAAVQELARQWAHPGADYEVAFDTPRQAFERAADQTRDAIISSASDYNLVIGEES